MTTATRSAIYTATGRAAAANAITRARGQPCKSWAASHDARQVLVRENKRPCATKSLASCERTVNNDVVCVPSGSVLALGLAG